MNIFINDEGTALLKSLGITEWGYTEEPRAQSFEKFNHWLNSQSQGKLSYLEGERGEKRRDLKEVFPNFSSALVFLFDYRETKKWLEREKSRRVAAYALAFEGRDYHFVIRERLEEVVSFLKREILDLDVKVCLDVEPVLERDLAYRSGLGWFGKNSMLIHPRHGSYFLIASILLSKKIMAQRSELESDHCGTCRKCLDACPTDAITESRTLLANRCIATFTIETFKEEDPPSGHQEDWIFGCDICQEVCPWNEKPIKNAVGHDQGSPVYQFFGRKDLDHILEELDKMSNRSYKKVFKGTALERPGRVGMIKNIKAIKEE